MSEPRTDSSAQTPPNQTILVVDDTPANLSSLTDYLKGQGYKTLIASTGAIALERAKYARPDLILLDVLMPGIDGFETCRRLKADAATRDIPVIFMTALTSTENKVKGFDAGGVDYVTKPIQHEEILARVSTHLRLRDLTKHLEAQAAEIQALNARLNAENIEVKAELRDAQRLADIGKITTSLSHEIRNPLSATKMNLQILSKSGQLSDDDRPHLELALQEVVRLEGMLSELLDFARPLFLKKRACRINAILTANLDLLAVKFQEKQLSPVTALEPEIPVVQADGEKLSRAFINLLLNAIEVSDEGGAIRVISRFLPDADPAAIDVVIEDDGPGIPPDRMSKIFTPFFTTRQGGTGLGLTNVKHIVEAHDGGVEASNRPSGGAAFRVRLPVEKEI